jgi:hypothetical protein
MRPNAAVYGTCGVVLIACLAAANMPSQDSDVEAPHPARVAPVEPDAIAADVQSQAARLHERMAEAPAPSAAIRNPFAFGASRLQRRAPDVVHATVATDPLPSVAPAPELLLMGIAGGGGDAIFMVVEGEAVAGRYRVAKIGADAVELEDQVTKGYRRLALR